MKSVILSFTVLVSVIVQSTTSREIRSGESQVALIPCNGLSIINDSDREGLTSIKYTWKFRGLPIQKICTKRSRASVSSYGDLLVKNFSKQDHGTYTCDVELVSHGFRVTDSVQKKVDDSYIISEIECSPRSCIDAKKCYHSSMPNTCPGKGEICCKSSS